MAEPEQHSVHDREIVGKLWGREEIIINDPEANYCGKILWLDPGYQSSLHYHEKKDETFMAVWGTVYLEYCPVNDHGHPQLTILRGWARDSIRIKPGVAHRFKCGPEGAKVIEFSTAHSDEDVVRLGESKKIE